MSVSKNLQRYSQVAILIRGCYNPTYITARTLTKQSKNNKYTKIKIQYTLHHFLHWGNSTKIVYSFNRQSLIHHSFVFLLIMNNTLSHLIYHFIFYISLSASHYIFYSYPFLLSRTFRIFPLASSLVYLHL